MSLAYLLDLILCFQACVRAVTGDYFLLSIDHLVYKPKVTSSNRQRKGQKARESLFTLIIDKEKQQMLDSLLEKSVVIINH